MLYQLLYALHDDVSWLRWLNVLRYTSTRILLATLTALILSLILYPWFIRTLQKIQLGQVVRDDGPKSHFSKRGTPTMGGLPDPVHRADRPHPALGAASTNAYRPGW